MPSAFRMLANLVTMYSAKRSVGSTRKATGVRRTGSAAVDLAYTACGRWDAYIERIVAAWDIAAGVGIILEAGGAVWTPTAAHSSCTAAAYAPARQTSSRR